MVQGYSDLNDKYEVFELLEFKINTNYNCFHTMSIKG